MSEFQLIKEDEHAFTVKHPSGKHFQVAKAGLDKKVIAKIKAMSPVKMADGGIVPDTSADPLKEIIGNTPGYADSGYRSFTTPPKPGEPWEVGDGGYRKVPGLERSPASDGTGPSRAPASFIGDAAHAIGSGIHDVYNAWNQNITQPIVSGVKDAATGLVSGVSGNPMPSAQAAPVPTDTQGKPPILSDAEAQAAAERQALMGANGGPTPASAAAPTQPQGVQLPKDMQNAYGMQIAGIKGNAQAAQAAGDQASQAWNDYNAQIQQREQAYQERLKAIDDEQNQLMQKFATNKVDPNRVWNNASTGNKIMAGLGLVLSGMGSGVTGQPNGALEIIQKKIDRDIEAQKSDKDTSRSLFQMNMEKYKNAQMAEEATRLQMNTALNAKLESIKATTGSQQAKANAQILQGQLQMQIAQQKHQMAMMQMQAGVYGSGSGQGGVPIGKEPPMLMLDEKYREHRVPINGTAYQAATKEGAEHLRKMESMYQPIVKDIALLNGLGSDAMVSPEKRVRAKAALGRIAMALNEFNGYNRFTEMDDKTLREQFNDPSAFMSILQGKGATMDTLNALKTKLENERSKNLIGYRGTADFQGTPVGNVNGR